MTDNKYYVYQYINDDGQPYYIGKGSKTRIREKHNHTIVPPPERRIIVKNLWADPVYRAQRKAKMMETRKRNGFSI